ncbi:MAG TPA: TonB-dependent receptor [Chitinophagales bacterium]|nr:TonB-dependent receptor [Chitinophagales bacterium]HNO27394.1 TonB-dependent receptor [Chitinophagales bacterium]
MKRLFTSLLTLMSVYALSGQSGTIRGFVYDIENGEPVPFVNVIVMQSDNIGAASDENGFFSIPEVPVGAQRLILTYIGYDTLIHPITVEAGQIYNVKLNMTQSGISLSTVTVSSKVTKKLEEVQISTTTITPLQIKRLPSVGGEPDLAQYLQVLPGVIFTGDQGGQLYIRGGSPIQNKVLLDGMVIYNPFHSIGLFSVFETDIIRNVDVYTGGFSAEYGDRVSAVVDITTRDGNKKQTVGEVSASPFLARVLLEGPLKKPSAESSSVTYILTAKHSYLDKTSEIFYPYVNSQEGYSLTQGIPYSFTDLYGKISINSESGNKFNVFGFNYRDSVNYSSITNYRWTASGAGTNFVIVPSASNILIEGVFAYSNYNMTQNEADEKPRTSNVGGFNGGVDFTYYLGSGDLQYGVEVIGFNTNYEFFNRLGIRTGQEQFTTELGSYVKFRKSFNKKFVIEPSIRLQYYASLSEFSPEPRIGMKYNITDRVRIKFAGGLYSQNLISSKSDRDVVNLFTGFLSGPDDDLYTIDGEEAKSKLQRSTHAIAGIEYDPTDFIELNIEPYIKYFNQLIEINRNKVTPRDADFATETGQAYGIDFSMKYDRKKLYIWLAYSLGFIERNDGEQVYPPHYDRRHNMNFVTTYTLGKRWELSARWNLGSGFPFTQTAGFYESVDFLDGISTDYTGTNGNLGIIYSAQLNGGRLPYYHRLDLAVKHNIVFANKNKVEINAGVTNVYNRDNIFYFDRVRYERVNQLPVLPSLSMSYSF